MNLKYCNIHGSYNNNLCKNCKKEIIINLQKEYDEKFTNEEKIKIENNWLMAK
jgi:hypothetical protein